MTTSSAFGMTLSEYSDLMGEIVDATKDATGAFAEALADSTKSAAEKIYEAAAYHAEWLEKAQHVADNYATRALTNGNEAASQAAARVSAYAQRLADQYEASRAIEFEKALALEVSPIAKAAGPVALGLDLLSYGIALNNGEYEEASQKLAEFTLGLMLTPLLIGVAEGLALAPFVGAALVFSGVLAGVVGLGLLWQHLPDSVRDFFDLSLAWRPRRDPLVLDLNGNGIETTAPNPANPVLFDHDANGVRTGTGWVSPSDGFLVMDRNGNGKIDSGAELFGDHTPLANGSIATDGFAALADLDSNHDGIINSGDTQFGQLRIWRDLNQDGLSQSNELLTLAASGVASIALAHTNDLQSLGNGNTIGSQGSFTRTDGAVEAIAGTDLADVNLSQDTFHREFTDHIPIADGVTALPNMQGSGMVRDLWEAASLSSGFKSVVQEYAAAGTRAEQKELVAGLIESWAATSGMKSFSQRFSEHSFYAKSGAKSPMPNTGKEDFMRGAWDHVVAMCTERRWTATSTTMVLSAA